MLIWDTHPHLTSPRPNFLFSLHLLSVEKPIRETMVKFSKQFQAQLVPEWKDAFVDYCQLKKELKKIQFLNSNNCSSKQPQNDSFPSAFLSCLGKVSLFGQKHRDRDTIQVLPPFLPCVCSVFQNWRDHCVLKCRFLKIFRPTHLY